MAVLMVLTIRDGLFPTLRVTPIPKHTAHPRSCYTALERGTANTQEENVLAP